MFISLHNHCHIDSLLDSCSRPEDIANRCKELGMTAFAITGHGSIASHPKIHDELKKKDIKSILGCELYISPFHSTTKDDTNKKHRHLPVVAKNYKGWKKLVFIISAANHPDSFYYKSRLSVEELGPLVNGNDIIAFSGHLGSTLSMTLWESQEKLYDDWEHRGLDCIKQHQEVFGKDNFFLEGQIITCNNERGQQNYQCVKRLSELTNIPIVATADSHYVYPNDAEDQRILLCSSLKTNLRELAYKLSRGQDIPMETFFKERCYYIPEEHEMLALHPKEEVELSQHIADMCEDYDIKQKPQLPIFDCPNELSEQEYLTQLCRDGWANKIKNKIDDSKIEEYTNRIKYELKTIEDAGLAAYFLVVQDYIKAAQDMGCITGVGRGSSAGSLIAYLTDITKLDPIPYGLIFERFYNAGRNTKDNVALPDIDTDFPINKREHIINYIKEKYGTENTAHIITFGKIKGKSALKEVIRAYGNMSYSEMNELTKHIPDEAKIADELQEMEDAGEEASIIRWSLENESKYFDGYCQIGDDGKLEGPYSKLFEQAIRLEGLNRSTGKHASGYVISREPLAEGCPMVYDTKSKQQICGFEYTDLEKVGYVKFDILGVAMLDKISYIGELINV